MPEDIDAILAAYVDASRKAGGTRLEEWVRRYPQHERTLVEFAVYDYVFEHGRTFARLATERESLFLSRAQTVRERLMAKQGLTAKGKPVCAIRSLLAVAKEHGWPPTALAQRLQLGVSVIVKLERRLLRPETLPRKLITELAQLLDRNYAEVIHYFQQPPTLSSQASYRASRAPHLVGQEEFRAALEASHDMTEEQKSYWRDALAEKLDKME